MNQNETKPVSIYEMPDGKKMIRVKTLDEDFLLDPKPIDNGKGYEFDKAMERLKELGLTTFNKKQAHVMAAYHEEINKAIDELGGDKLNWEWLESEYNADSACFYYGDGCTVRYIHKYYACQVRPVFAFPLKEKRFVDLGLSTEWSSISEEGFYTYEEAVSRFGASLPTKEQWNELIDKCEWKWMGTYYKVIGPNGNSIELPAAGYLSCNGSVHGGGSYGYYWSSTPHCSDSAWRIIFDSVDVEVNMSNRCFSYSVHFVQINQNNAN